MNNRQYLYYCWANDFDFLLFVACILASKLKIGFLKNKIITPNGLVLVDRVHDFKFRVFSFESRSSFNIYILNWLKSNSVFFSLFQ